MGKLLEDTSFRAIHTWQTCEHVKWKMSKSSSEMLSKLGSQWKHWLWKMDWILLKLKALHQECNHKETHTWRYTHTRAKAYLAPEPREWLCGNMGHERGERDVVSLSSYVCNVYYIEYIVLCAVCTEFDKSLFRFAQLTASHILSFR